jgi:hypothetical protein
VCSGLEDDWGTSGPGPLAGGGAGSGGSGTDTDPGRCDILRNPNCNRTKPSTPSCGGALADFAISGALDLAGGGFRVLAGTRMIAGGLARIEAGAAVRAGGRFLEDFGASRVMGRTGEWMAWEGAGDVVGGAARVASGGIGIAGRAAQGRSPLGTVADLAMNPSRSTLGKVLWAAPISGTVLRGFRAYQVCRPHGN